MAEIRLTTQPRTEFGKGAARRLRKIGQVPAVLYGLGDDAQHFSVNAIEFARAIKGDANALLTLEIDGRDQLALPRAITRHPIKDYFQHIDMLIVKRGQKVAVEVPVHLVGDAAPGTLVLHDLTLLNVEADALNIPERIEVSIEGAEPGSHITAGDIELPDGATLVEAPDTLVVAIQVAPSASDVESETTEVVAEAEAAPDDEA